MIRMKNKIKILTILAFGAMLLPTCQKDPNLPYPDLQEGVAPVILKNTDLDQTLDVFNLSAFNASVDVDIYFETLPQSMTIMISMNDDYENKAVLRENVTTFPTSIGLTANDLVTLLPGLDSINQLQPGDFFRVYAVTTLEDGTVIDGLDTLYNAYGDGIANLPGSSVDVVYPVVCPYDPDFATGSYRCVSEGWNVDGDVTITADPEDPYTIYVVGMAELDGAVEDLGPMVMHINPATYEVTVDRSILSSSFFGYHNFAYSGSGVYNSCDGSYELKLQPSVDEGGWNPESFTFTRND